MKFPPIWDGFRCVNTIVTAELTASKIHLIPSQWAGVLNPALTIPGQKSPWAKLGKNSQNLGTLKSAIKSAGLNAPAYWNGIRWIFDAVNNAVTIVFAQQEPSKIGRNCLTNAIVHPAAPGGKSDVSRLWTPNRRTKIKSPHHLKFRLWFDMQKWPHMGSSFISIGSGWPSHLLHLSLYCHTKGSQTRWLICCVGVMY